MKIAFLSMNDLSGYVSDDELAIKPLQELGYSVDTLPWQQTAVKWNDYAAVIIRTTWDYQNHLPQFLKVLSQIESETRLANPLDIVKWNADKIYLQDLANRGAKAVPTLWFDGKIERAQFSEWFEALRADEIIIKPRVSANAQDTFRLNRQSLNKAEVDIANLSALFNNRPCMIQPFMREIISEGEFSLFYFNGEYSHAILKTPKTEDFRVQEEHGGIIISIKPEEALLAAGEEIIRSIPKKLLYARVDLVRTARDKFALMELELIEPSLYFRTAENAPSQFARAIDSWLSEK